MDKRPITPEDLLELHLVSDPQVSPCGQSVSFTKSKVNDKNSYDPQVWVVDVTSKESRQLTTGEKGAGGARWSPCGSKLAFVSGRQGGTAQIYLLPMDGGEGQAVTSLSEGGIRSMAWSPDGTKIAFEYRPTAAEWTRGAAEERKSKGLSTPPRVIETLWYRLDGDGFFDQQRYAIWVLDLESGEAAPLYGGCAVDFYSYDWLTDSSGLVVGHSANPDPLLDEPNDQLYVVRLDGSAEMVGGLPGGSKGTLRVSPCGLRVAYLGDEDTKDPWGVRNTRLYVAALDGSGCRLVTDKGDYCLEAASLTDTGAGSGGICEWRPDGTSIRIMLGWHGESHLGEVDVASGEIRQLTSNRGVYGTFNLSADGLVQAMTFGTPLRPADVAVFRDGQAMVLTDFNREFLERVEVVDPVEQWVESTDGVKVQAWVMKPSEPLDTGAAVLEVHGGPHTQYALGFFHEFQVLCAQGYTVVFSNPRGSKGYGEDFCAAIRGDWGNKDWDDVQAVTEWMKTLPGVSADRIGIMGGSYGGYMTNWAIGHSHAYRSAITDRCVSNWISMAGNSDFPLNRDAYFGGYAWGDLGKIEKLWQQSPLSYFDQVKTPTLIIHSEGDFRCNVEQSDQVFHALMSQGIKTKYVRYPLETSHGMSRNGPPDLRLHRLHQILDWWKETLA